MGYKESFFEMEAVQSYRKNIERVMKDSKKGNEIEHILTKDLEENEKETVIRTGEKEAQRLKEEKQIREWEQKNTVIAGFLQKECLNYEHYRNEVLECIEAEERSKGRGR